MSDLPRFGGIYTPMGEISLYYRNVRFQNDLGLDEFCKNFFWPFTRAHIIYTRVCVCIMCHYYMGGRADHHDQKSQTFSQTSCIPDIQTENLDILVLDLC